MSNASIFLKDILDNIKKADAFQYKKINGNIKELRKSYPSLFEELLELIYRYFKDGDYNANQVSADYLHMVNDMRKEGKFFYKTGEYYCKSQEDAYKNVYSNKEVMSYYMTALLISQVLWKHHFLTFVFFQEEISNLFPKNKQVSIFDVGPGHGFFSFLVKKEFPEYKKIDIVDISETSLEMAKKVLGYDGVKISYTLQDIFKHDGSKKYDLILLGEVIEHLDDPGAILKKMAALLKEDGVLWVTTPTNAPALDHVHLFENREEVLQLLQECGLSPKKYFSSFAENVDEATALNLKVTNLVSVFCKKDLL